MSTRHVFVVLTAPTEGMEEEFNRWYDDVHLADVLKLDDYVAAQRYRFVPLGGEHEPLRPYLALYETMTDDVPATTRRLAAVAGTDAMPFSPAIDQSKSVAWYYEPISERLTDGSDTSALGDPRKFVVLGAPTAGMEDEYKRWYVEQHMPDVLKLDAFVAVQWHRFVPTRPDSRPLRPYLAIYDMQTDDDAAALHELASTATTAAMPYTPAIDRSQSIGWCYEPITDRRTSS